MQAGHHTLLQWGGVKVWTLLCLEVTLVCTDFSHADVHQLFSLRSCLDEKYLVVEEAVDSEFNAVVLIPMVSVGIHAK